jgi:hypothetical protein
MMGRLAFLIVLAATAAAPAVQGGQNGDGGPARPIFHSSDRCIACHNGLVTPSGEDVSIGFEWRASIMANSSRDPYWQASVRRETMDHPKAKAAIEDSCATCHMPMARFDAKRHGKRGEVFAHLSLQAIPGSTTLAADGVSCSLCHQIGRERLGSPKSFSGEFVIDGPDAAGVRHEYGPFEVTTGHRRIMISSTEGYQPTRSEHIRQSELCATCHTLVTETLGPDGKPIGRFPEQVPYQEWLHSEFRSSRSCQSCHMPVIEEPVPITRIFGTPRDGVRRHTFVGANFFVQRMLNRYHGPLSVAALPQELTAAADGTLDYLGSQAARLSIEAVSVANGRLQADVDVENLGGHKLPTAYPSRRAWLHVAVRDAHRHIVFESGALNPDGSIRGNDNDADATSFEPHYTEVRTADEVEIYESILSDPTGRVTTGLLSGARYLKDNRLLPRGFDKGTAEPDIAVIGEAAADADFTGGGDRVRYSVPVSERDGPFQVEAELLYQPIGFRWAHNLRPYDASEPKRFVEYYQAMSTSATATLARVRR